MKKNIGYLLLMIIFFVSSCKEDDALSKKVDFDRKALLEHYADHIIPRHYKLLNENVLALDSVWKKFKSQPNDANLSLLRYYFVESYKSWQYCSLFEFGPAEQILLRANVNTFPTDTIKISTNIRTGSFNLNTASNLDAKGLPALDFLLFDKKGNVVANLSSSSTQLYIDAVLTDLKNNIGFVYFKWTDGSYRNEFVAKDGVDIGSSLGHLVNQLNFDLELIKNAKIGIPLGKKTMGEPLPHMAEGFYSGISKELMLLNLNSIKNIFAGNVNDQILGTGLDEYLRAVSAKNNGVDLDLKIFEQLTNAKNAIEALPSNLSDAIISQPSTVETAYTEVQRCIIYTKTDMPSALGIMITYQDNDGD
jgi:predicted lipoprotein